MTQPPTLLPAPAGLVINESPVSNYLAKQRTLETPVARFSEQHDALSLEGIGAFSTLIPLTQPGPGQQYAFEVDMDRCTGCKACVAGCHSMNGLHDEETWRDVGLVHGFIDAQSYQQTVTTACHHCADPACLNGCPVLAYEKDPITGIVSHLDDQCIGCQYCVLKCPYEVPKYNPSLGIVRKCDMCQNRLATGEAPACVQACPTEAIRIAIVTTEPMREASTDFLTAAPDPAYTRPTTRYLTQRKIPQNLEAADAHSPRVEHAHYPLVFMLILTQGGVGGVFSAVAWHALGHADAARFSISVGLVLLLSGLAASMLHLGRPLGAWRAFLGLRRSWLSREIVLFGAFTPLAVMYGALSWGIPTVKTALNLLPLGLIPLGIAAVFSSAMIYVDTQRYNWRLPITLIEFAESAALLGFGITATSAAITGAPHLFAGIGWPLTVAIVLMIDRIREATAPDQGPAKLRVIILDTQLKIRQQQRRGLLISAFALAVGGLEAGTILMVPALFATLAGELIGRALYFQAVIAPKMPGGYHR